MWAATMQLVLVSMREVQYANSGFDKSIMSALLKWLPLQKVHLHNTVVALCMGVNYPKLTSLKCLILHFLLQRISVAAGNATAIWRV